MEADLVFQFLIGTIKTKYFGVTIVAVQVFQFLIGTIKTYALRISSKGVLSFNSS